MDECVQCHHSNAHRISVRSIHARPKTWVCNTYDRDLGGAFGGDVCSCRGEYHQLPGATEPKTDPVIGAIVIIIAVGLVIAFIIDVVRRTEAVLNFP